MVRRSVAQRVAARACVQTTLTVITGYAAYASSKYALRGLAESLCQECKAFGVWVSLVLPPDTGAWLSCLGLVAPTQPPPALAPPQTPQCMRPRT